MDEWIESLKDSDETVRDKAIAAWAAEGADALPNLRSALGHQDSRVRAGAASVLGRIGPDIYEAVPDLIAALGESDATVCEKAAAALGRIGPRALPQLIDALSNESTSTMAAVALVRMDVTPAEIVPALISLLHDELPAVHRQASEALSKYGSRAVPHLLDALATDDDVFQQRVAAVLEDIGKVFQILGDMNPESLDRHAHDTVPTLIKILKTERTVSTARRMCAVLLGRLGSRAKLAIPALNAALFDSDQQVRIAVTEALESINPQVSARPLALDDESDVPALVKALEHNDASLRKRAAEVLRDLGPAAADAVDALTKALADSSDPVAEAAAMALGAIGEPAARAVPALIQALESDGIVREAAPSSLAMLGPLAADAVGQLTAALSDENPLVRVRSAWALGEIGPGATSAVPALKLALGEPEPWLRLRAAESIWKLNSDAAGVGALADLLQDDDGWTRKHAAEVLASIGSHAVDAVPALTTALRSNTQQIRELAARTLGKIGPAAAPCLPTLLKVLEDDDDKVREAAADAVRHIDSDAAASSKVDLLPGAGVPALVEALSEEEPERRRRAAESLEQLGPFALKAIPALVVALRDDHDSVRLAAAQALSAIGPEVDSVLNELQTALADKHPPVRIYAARAICQTGADREAAVALLCKVLKADSVADRRAAVESLGLLDPDELMRIGGTQPDMAAGLMNLVVHESLKNSTDYTTCAHLLSGMGPSVVPLLVRGLAGADRKPRLVGGMVARAIGPAAVPALIEFTSDEDARNRRTAIELISRIGKSARQAMTALIRVLKDESPAVREAAIEALNSVVPDAPEESWHGVIPENNP